MDIENRPTSDARVRIRHTGWASWVFVAMSVSFMMQPFTDALPRHIPDTTWPAHAHFHLSVGLVNQFCLGVITILIARIPFRRGERWSWFALVLSWLTLVSLVPSSAYFGSGPEPHLWYPVGGLMLAAFIALSATAPLGLSRRS